MPNDDLIVSRQKLVIDPAGVVVINVILEENDGAAVFECTPCANLMAWSSDRHMYICDSCEYELTDKEGDLLAGRYISAVSSLIKIQKEEQKKRGFLRWLWEWLSGARRRK